MAEQYPNVACQGTALAGDKLYLVFADGSTLELDGQVALSGQETLDCIERGDIKCGEDLALLVIRAMSKSSIG